MSENMKSKRLAFINTPVSKPQLMAQLRLHYQLDEIIKGQYWQNGKGCAVGCAVHTSEDPHAAVEERFNIPQILARLADGIFEELPNDRAKEWPLEFFGAVKEGTPFEVLVQKGWEFLHWLLVDPEDGVIKFADEQGKVAIQRVADLYARQIAGETISEEDWNAAYAAAAAYAAYAAAADAAYAAYAYAAYAYAARIKQADKLLELLRNAPIAEMVAP